MNEYDSLKLERLLQNGYERTDAPENADLVLINTCSVRDKPEQKLYSLLGEMKELKERRPEMLIGVGGCVAQQEGEKIIKRSRAVDFVFGTHNLSVVPSLINLRRSGAAPQVAVDYRDEWEELPAGFVESERVSVFISISRGCNKNCTYCIVPTTRGPEVSRPMEEIEREARIALHRGAKEIVLLGQTVNSYGRDLSPKITFVELLERLSRLEGLKRIRFTSPHPQEVREDFFELVSSNPKVCRHIHMPLQSGSDRILKLMNRNYRRAKYLSIIEALKERVPDIAITTDIIVGFPGETEREFQETLDIMEQVQFDNSYSFVFSPRPGTAAAEMKDDLPHSEKLKRLQILQAKQDEILQCKLTSWVGQEVEVLLEGPSAADPAKLQGRTSQNFTVNLVDQYPVKSGDLVQCRIRESARYTLKGELCGEPETGGAAQ
ncbi:MAG: tRNA (N6-isopentenyl adenosine(37)-C2)-methylthiotransferase MiaB [Deltaproteobacteria bacterium]|nr:tRNA (N6-isopentenyl adenosine(37)-C2)-methylthiotransferase MiaB [Deltaproteobacteria bacterium]